MDCQHDRRTVWGTCADCGLKNAPRSKVPAHVPFPIDDRSTTAPHGDPFRADLARAAAESESADRPTIRPSADR